MSVVGREGGREGTHEFSIVNWSQMRVKNPKNREDVIYELALKFFCMPYRDSDGVVDAVVDDGEEDDGGHGQEGQHGEGDEGHDGEACWFELENITAQMQISQ